MPLPDDRPRWAELTCRCCGGRKRYRVPRADRPEPPATAPLSPLAFAFSLAAAGAVLAVATACRVLGIRL